MSRNGILGGVILVVAVIGGLSILGSPPPPDVSCTSNCTVPVEPSRKLVFLCKLLVGTVQQATEGGVVSWELQADGVPAQFGTNPVTFADPDTGQNAYVTVVSPTQVTWKPTGVSKGQQLKYSMNAQPTASWIFGDCAATNPLIVNVAQ